MTVSVEIRGRVTLVTLSRPGVSNAVDGPTALALADAFRAFDQDPETDVAVFYGDHGSFCAGADLKAMAADRPTSPAPMTTHSTPHALATRAKSPRTRSAESASWPIAS